MRFHLYFPLLVNFLTTLPGHGAFIPGKCPRSVVYSKIVLTKDEMFVLRNQTTATSYSSSDLHGCFRTCCDHQVCNGIVYSGGECLAMRCPEGKHANGFCTYRPSQLLEAHIHLIIIDDKGLLKKDYASIGWLLDRLQFRNGPSLVTSDMKFAHVQQCGQYVEPENVSETQASWVTPRFSSYPYLYELPHKKAPPLGMRSAVPLGGLGTGSFELRADGTFHEWTVENQSPGGSAKLGHGALDLAVLGVRVQTRSNSRASLLRTHPPDGDYPGVQGLQYSGAYPVSKLGIQDEGFFGVKMELYAYGTIQARDTQKSHTPAVVFSLRVYNPTNEVVNVSLLLNLPLGEQPDTLRSDHDSDNQTSHVSVTSSVHCASLCDRDSTCMAWSLDMGSGQCVLMPNMPLHSYKEGMTSGVKGLWSSTSDSSLTYKRPGHYPNSGSTTIRAIAESNLKKVESTVPTNITTHGGEKASGLNHKQILNPSFGVSDDFRVLWKEFTKYGRFRGSIRNSSGFHGSGVVTNTLGPGQNGTLTLVMAWHYPYRDHAGEFTGSRYSEWFSSSDQVATSVEKDLRRTLLDLISWRENMTPEPVPPSITDQLTPDIIRVNSSLDDWLQDTLVNSLSYWRSGFWVQDGRWRQWEAFDCNDIDSVHNDFQRELPYIIFFPELLENVVRSWAAHQTADGVIKEALQGQFGCWSKTNRLDQSGGRFNMADVNSAFIAQVYHLYLWTGNRKLLKDLWLPVIRAAQWMIWWGANGTALPLRMTNTYDILQLQRHDFAIYNGVMHLLGLRAAEELGKLQEDHKFAAFVQQHIHKARRAIDKYLWVDKLGYYRAWWDKTKKLTTALMADSLYGQVWAYLLGLKELLNENNMKSHLLKEEQLNDTPYGLQVMSGFADNKRGKREANAHLLDHQNYKYRVLRDLDLYFSNTNNYFSDINSYGMNDNRYGVGIKDYYKRWVENYQQNTYRYWAQYNKWWETYNAQLLASYRRFPSYVWNKMERYDNGVLPMQTLEEQMNNYWAQNHLKDDSNEVLGEESSKDQGMKKTYSNFEDGSGKRKITGMKDKTKVKTKKARTKKIKNKDKLGAKKQKKKKIDPINKSPTDCHKFAATARWNSIWMGGSSDWSTLQIQLGVDPTLALKQAQKSLEHYRSTLNDLWNIHGLTSGPGYRLDGLPWCTSHYTFHMVLWHIPFALSGQQYSKIDKSLQFYPKITLPFSLPFFTPEASGTLEAKQINGGVLHKLLVTHGYLEVDKLAISTKHWPGVVKLKQGEFIAW